MTPTDFSFTSTCNNITSSKGANRQSCLVSRTPSPSFLLGGPTAPTITTTTEEPTQTMIMLIEQAKLIGEINHLVNEMGGGHHPATAASRRGVAVVHSSEQHLEQSGVFGNSPDPAASWASTALSALTPKPFPWAAGGTIMGATMASVVLGDELSLQQQRLQHVPEQQPQELRQQLPPRMRCFGDPQYFPPYHHPDGPPDTNKQAMGLPTITLAHCDHRLVSNDNNGNDDDDQDNDDLLSGLFRVFGSDTQKF
ncbi:hypothetical protein ACA910_004695 [Epithemia clementina (nom. ined.)]